MTEFSCNGHSKEFQTAAPGRPDKRAGRREPGGILSRAVVTLLGSVGGGALTFLNGVLVAGFLGARIYGIYAWAFALTRIGETLSLFGVRVGVLHFLPVYRDRAEPGHVAGTVWASIAAPLLIGCSLAPFIWLIAPWLANAVFHEPSAIPFIRIIAIAIPFMSISEALGMITRAYGHAKHYVITRNIVPTVTFFVLILLVRHLNADPIWITKAFVVSYSLAVIAGSICVAKVIGPILWQAKPIFRFGRLYKYSFPIMINSLLYMIITWTDILMVGYFRGADQVGIYRACIQVVLLFDMVLLAFTASTAHIYPVLEKDNKWDELSETYNTAVQWITMLAVGLFLVAMLNRYDVLSLFGAEFTSGTGTLLVLGVGFMLKCCLGLSGLILVLCGRQLLETTNAGIAAVSNVILNLLLIPRYGIGGAAVATAVSLMIISLMRVLEVRHLMGLRTLRLPVLKVFLAGAIVGILVAFLTSTFGAGDGSGWHMMVLRMAGTVVLWFVALWRFGLDQRERALLRQSISYILVQDRNSEGTDGGES